MNPAQDGHALLTDLYELTMAAGYFERQLDVRATFELFVRSLPPNRAYLVACGLEAALEYLENLSFTKAEIDFLRGLPAFRSVSQGFFDFLSDFRFSGEVEAVAEGTIVFAGEPLLQVSAPIIQAQIVETYLLSVLNFETLIATKAARVVHAAQGRDVVEFGTRRAQGPEAGLRAARAAYVAGCAGTSNVLAGSRWGIPLVGTAAHSWTQAFPTERQSFKALLETFPKSAFLLLDTYDTLAAAEMAGSLCASIPGVRLDSGDLLKLSCGVRNILDRHGLAQTMIMASGDLNEYKIANLIAAGAPIDLFGVGTELATSYDAPSLNVVYKLVETEQGGQVHYKTKAGEGKSYPPGRKQVYRFMEQTEFHHDLVCRSGESHPGGTPLLEPVMKSGRRTAPAATVEDVRKHALDQVKHLPENLKALDGAANYPVEESTALRDLSEQVRGDLLSSRLNAVPARSDCASRQAPPDGREHR